MREHLEQYQEEILSKVKLHDNDLVLDIGSNDSTMLQLYSNKLKRIGIDPTGDNYLICNETSVVLLMDLVINIYKLCDIELTVIGKNLFHKYTKELVIEIVDNINGLEKSATNIQGYPHKLKNLNWSPKISLNELLKYIVYII